MAPRVGADLAAARERLGRTLPDMAAALCIRRPYLQALEQGHLSDLPGNAYALVFLRSYAAALGLDPDELSRRFKAEAAEVSRKADLVFPLPLPDRGLPAGVVALLCLVLAVGGYAAWYRLSGEGRLPAEAVAPVPARLAPLAEQATPPVTPPVVVAAVPPGVPASASPPGSTGAVATDPSLSPSSAAAATPTPTQPPASPDASQQQAGLIVRASADAWIQVRDRSGQVLFSRILHAGESWPVPSDSSNLVLTTGNAGGTELVLDGTATPPLGNPGAVRRDLPLDPDAIRSGRLMPVTATR
ncbi:MAG TPA: RodZ domain-containing protein [Acetobacteraceae bacterium]